MPLKLGELRQGGKEYLSERSELYSFPPALSSSPSFSGMRVLSLQKYYKHTRILPHAYASLLSSTVCHNPSIQIPVFEVK
jgi:hypothetical protein